MSAAVQPNPRKLDVRAAARDGAVLRGATPLAQFPRLAQESAQPAADAATPVDWEAEFSVRNPRAAAPQIWLELKARTRLTQTCQRCLGPMSSNLAVDRRFRFVADETQAAAEDEEAEEDVLALEPRMDLLALVEDELLMELPLAPRHETCPTQPKLQAQTADFQAPDAAPNPFAALASLRVKDGA